MAAAWGDSLLVLSSRKGAFMIADFNHKDLKLELQNPQFSVNVVPTAKLDSVWPFVRPALEKYPELWDRTMTIETLRALLDAGACTLWVVLQDGLIAMAFVTQVTNYPTARCLEVVWGVGRGIDEWLPLVLSALENFAGRVGIEYVDVCGRKGWERPLAPYGYEYVSSRFVKRITRESLNG